MTLTEIRALIEAATPGPWTADGEALSWEEGRGYASYWVEANNSRRFLLTGYDDTGSGMCDSNADAIFIAAARTLMPLLLDLAEAAKRIHEYADSPLPNAQLLFEDANFDLFKALAALEGAK